jgi:hypothetical protein
VHGARVVALVHRHGFDGEAAIPYRVEQRHRERGFVLARGFDSPGEWQAGADTDGGVDLVAVEAAALAGGDGGAVAPGGVGVAESFALASALGDEALAVRVGGHVAAVDGDVNASTGKLASHGCGETVEAGVQERLVGAELRGEAVAGVDGRRSAESALQRRVVCDQRGGAAPCRDLVEALDEACSDQRADASPHAPLWH